MSLEQAIIDNTAAIRELIAAISNGIPTTGAQVAAVVEEVKAEEKQAKVDKKTKSETKEAPKSTEAPAVTQEQKDESAAAAVEVTYQEAAAAITSLSRVKGRDAAVALLKKFGAAKLPDVKPEDFAAIVEEANEQAGA